MFQSSASTQDKAFAGRDLLRFAFDGGAGSPLGSDGASPTGAPAQSYTMVRIHGLLDKPSGASMFRSEEWRPRFFVLRTDLTLEYFEEPKPGSGPPHWRQGLVPYQQVASSLGGTPRGSYSLAELGVKQARAEGPRLHIYLSRDVRLGGKQVRELQFRACAEDRNIGVPHAARVMQDWAQAVNELLDQQRRGGPPLQTTASLPAFGSGCSAPAPGQPPPCGPFDSRASWGSMQLPAPPPCGSQAAWSQNSQNWSQGAPNVQLQELQAQVEQLRWSYEMERQRSEALEQRVRELEAEKLHTNGCKPGFPSSPQDRIGRDIASRPNFQKAPTLEAFQQQQHQQQYQRSPPQESRQPRPGPGPYTIAQAMQLPRSSPPYP